MPTRLDELFYEISVRQQEMERQLNRLQAGLRRSDRATRDFDASARRASKSTTGFSGSIKRLAGALGGLFLVREAARSLVEFDRAIREIATIAPGGKEQVDRLRVAILELTRSVPQSASELGAGAYQILSAGITDTADVISVLEASSRAAVAGLTDTETAVDATTTVINAFRKEAGEAERVTDVLFKTVELGKLRFDEIAQNIGSAATSAALAGITFEELSAAAAVMTQRGIDAAESFNSLNRLALTLVQQTDEQRAAFERLEISFDTATVAEKGFAGLLEELNQLTQGQVDQLAELFPNIRAARSAFILAGSATDDYRKTLDQLNESQGAAKRAFDENSQSIDNLWKLLRNQLNRILQRLAGVIMPPVILVFEGWNRLIDRILENLPALGRKLLGIGRDAEALKDIREDIAGIVREAEKLGTERITLGVVIGPELVAAAREFQRLKRELETLERTPTPAQAGPGFELERQLRRRELEREKRLAAERIRLLRAAAAELGQARAEAEEEAGRDAAAQAEALAAARVRIEEQLTKRLAALTEEVTAAQIAEIRRLRDAYKAAGGTISKSLAEDLEKAEASAKKSAERRSKEREDIQQELASRVSEITLTAAEQEIAAVAELRAAYLNAFPEISAEAEEQFAAIEAAAEEALRREKAEQLAQEFKRAIEEGFAQIELQAIGIADPEEQQAFALKKQQDLLGELLDQAHARLEASETTTEEEKKLREVIKEIVKLLGQAKGEQEDLGEEANRDAERRLRDLERTILLVREAADGAIDLAEAFGLVNEETRETLDNLTQLAAGAATLAAGIGSGDPASIISGALGLLGGLAGLVVGGGEDPQAEALRRALEENQKALRDLADSVDSLRGTFTITGSDFSLALRALEDLFSFEDPFELLKDLNRAEELLLGRLSELGLSMGDLERIAEELGITLRDQAGNIIPQALFDLEDALHTVRDSLVGFPETIAGVRSRLQAEFDLLDIDDPFEQFKRFVEELMGLDAAATIQAQLEALREELENTTDPIRRLNLQAAIAGLEAQLAGTVPGIPAFEELFGIDVSTAEGRRAAEALIEQLFRDLAAGVITPEALGVATFEEAVDILRTLEGLLDEMAEGQGDVAGETQDVRRSVQITEVQAHQLLAFASTQADLQRQMRDRLTSILDVLRGEGLPPPIVPPPVPPPAGALIPATVPGAEGFAPGVSVVVNIGSIVVEPGATREQAIDVADALVERLDRELGQRVRDMQRLLGRR